MVNYYEVLGVSPLARPDEIKSAHRMCVRETHPDRQGDLDRFRAVQEAYEVLGNPEKRSRYDELRSDWLRRIGAIGCLFCGHANRILRRPSERERVVCQRCKTPLPLTFADVLQVQQQALVYDAARFVDEVGMDLADLAFDAARMGLDRLRIRFGIRSKVRTKV